MYLDEEDNFCINDHYLEERNPETTKTVSSETEETKTAKDFFLIQRIRDLEDRILSSKELSLSEVEHKFVLSKFNGKQEASTWINLFERECTRFKISESATKVEALKLFMEENAKEWYSASLVKFPLSDWESWKKSFLLIYEKKTWSSIRTAFNYKYLFGSLIDFVLKKERLLLEADKDMPELFRIYQIVFNLPLEVQDKLDRDNIKTITDLVTEIKKFNDSYMIKKRLEEKKIDEMRKSDITKIKFVKSEIEKKPCPICETLGYKNRYHPSQICRNRTKPIKNHNYWTEGDDENESDKSRCKIEKPQGGQTKN